LGRNILPKGVENKKTNLTGVPRRKLRELSSLPENRNLILLFFETQDKERKKRLTRRQGKDLEDRRGYGRGTISEG